MVSLPCQPTKSVISLCHHLTTTRSRKTEKSIETMHHLHIATVYTCTEFAASPFASCCSLSTPFGEDTDRDSASGLCTLPKFVKTVVLMVRADEAAGSGGTFGTGQVPANASLSGLSSSFIVQESWTGAGGELLCDFGDRSLASGTVLSSTIDLVFEVDSNNAIDSPVEFCAGSEFPELCCGFSALQHW